MYLEGVDEGYITQGRVQALRGTGYSKSSNQEGNKNIVKIFELYIKIE